MSSRPASPASSAGAGAAPGDRDVTPVSLTLPDLHRSAASLDADLDVDVGPSDRSADSRTPDADAVGPGTESATGRRSARWWIVRLVVVAVVGLVVYYLVTLYQVWSTGRADERGAVDAIVVMGAAQYDGEPSPQLAARLDHVVELWPTDVAPLVVVTGGNRPGDRFTEAGASRAYLVERGIPESAILDEDEGEDSFESLDAVADLLAERGVDDVVIVTDPYHALRSRLIAEEVGLDASVSSTDTSVVDGGENLERHLQEAAGVALGRIIGFERLASLTD